MAPESRRTPTKAANALLTLFAILLSSPSSEASEEIGLVAGTHSLLKSQPPIAVKKGAILAGLDRRMYFALQKARRVWSRYGKLLVVTSGLDGRHKKGSLHYVGLAVDLRSRYFAPSTRRTVTRELRRNLGDEFQVIDEKHHIHVEFDP
ncbi:hypothetical protein [Methylocaldum marinum]|nr:hypothetical protein [Methylocaldum marinum]